LKYQPHSIIDSINDLIVNVADPKTWVFWCFRYYRIICSFLPL